MKKLSSLAFAVAAILSSAGLAQVKVDPKIPPYEPISGVTGSLNAIGSGTLGTLMTSWGQSYSKLYGGVKFQVESKGSGHAPTALTQGTAQLGPMSRKISDKEVDGFEAKFGYKPTEVRVAVDALAVFVHKDNPLTKLTMPQIDAIFGKSRKLGHKEDLTKWGQLGLTGAWAEKPIRLYGRDTASGTYGYFKEHSLGNGDFKDSVKSSPGPEGVVGMVGGDPEGIGYSGIGNTSSDVKLVSVATKADGEYVEAGNQENVYSGKYPLARYLFVYVNKAPGKPLDPLVGQFLRYALSAEGQGVVSGSGFMPLKAKTVSAELEKLGFPALNLQDKPAADSSHKK